MSGRRLPNNLHDLLKQVAPALWDDLQSPDTALRAQAAHVVAQALLLAANGPAEGGLEPLRRYRPVPPEGIPGLAIENPQALVLVGEDVSFKQCRVAGTAPAILLIGSGAELIKTTFAGRAALSVFSLGFGTRIEGMLMHTLSRLGVVSIGSGTSAHVGGNFFTQEDSYIILGDDCMLSTNVFVRASDSHSIYAADTRQRINRAAPVLIHRHVWISRAVSINKGVVIGEDTVVGQGSIVSGRLDPGSVYAGVPARKLRDGVFWDRGLASALDPSFDFAASNFNKAYRRIRDGLRGQPLAPQEPSDWLHRWSALEAAEVPHDHAVRVAAAQALAAQFAPPPG